MNLTSYKSIGISLLVTAFVFFACSTKADSVNPIESVKDYIFDEEEKDLEGKFSGKETKSKWNVEITQTKNIKVTNGLFFVDDKHGWIIGAFDTIYRTEDGGKNWEKIDIQTPEKTVISQIFFANPNDGWVVHSKYNVSILESGNEQFWIMKTNNGGKSWKSTFTDRAAVAGEIKFANEKVGYLTGYKHTEPDARPIKAAQGLFLRTIDGGETWTDLSKNFNDFKAVEDKKIQIRYMSDIADNIYFFNPDHLRLTTASRRILETKNGGLSWSKISQYAHDDAQVGIKNFGYKDDGTEWYLESTYSIEGIRARLKEKNSRNEITRRLIEGVYFDSAFYLSDNSFVASGREGNLTKDGDKAVIWLTGDDGQTWTEIYRNEKLKGIGKMVQAGKNSFWALCDNGQILHLTKAE